MALFVDYLSVMLLSLGASAAYLAWYIWSLGKTAKGKQELAVPIFALGVFNAIGGFTMSFTWPLPGGYNMLFGDPLLFLGLLMIAGAYMLRKNISLKSLAMPGFLLGVYILVGAGAIVGYTLEPGIHFLPSFSLYLFAGLSGIISPITAYLSPKGSGKYAYYLLTALLVLTAIAALFLAYTAFYEHIGSFSKWFP